MLYQRPAYPGPDYEGTYSLQLYGNAIKVPKIDTPIPPVENFKRAAARNNPLWVPNSMTDMQTLMLQDLADGPQIGPDFKRRAKEDYTFTDWFNVLWTWVHSAGGAVTTPGIVLLDDITKWESVVKFPELGQWEWREKADSFLKKDYDENKALQIDIGPGCIQRLISLLGGYTEGMFALALEPEAVKDFFNRFADFMIELVDHLMAFYPVNLLTIHDDWGTERDTFFSPQMMEDLVFEPTKRIIEHIKAKNCAFMMHSCGNVSRFIPYLIDMKADFLQLQRRSVDVPAMKAKYGDKIGFNAGMEIPEWERSYTKEEMIRIIHNTVEIYGKHGGFFSSVFEMDSEKLWDYTWELYAYSREYYDRQKKAAEA
ncbi:MAG: hypothetical protein GX111_09265 [Clostridiales bacterium]|jgi:hypothetical protein|nr:hypothetical protein [Clostridiales bacterium]